MNFVKTYTEAEVENVAAELLGIFSLKLQTDKSLIVSLTGDLGAGKTTLCREMLRQMKITEPVSSPTFVLRKDYKGFLETELDVVHIDAYRLENKEQIAQIFDLKNVDKKTLVLVEWGELADLPYDIKIFLEHLSENARQISLTA
jgi:tRNA threonylcarbamoyladenosine biosynthesis protein TsaE